MEMTSGEYVFIMMTLQKIDLTFGGKLDQSWIVTPRNEKLVRKVRRLDPASIFTYTTHVCAVDPNVCLQGIPFQVYPHKAVLLLSFVLSYSEESVRAIRETVLNISQTDFNFKFPGDQVAIASTIRT